MAQSNDKKLGVGDVLYTANGEPHPIIEESRQTLFMRYGCAVKKRDMVNGQDSVDHPSYFISREDALAYGFMMHNRWKVAQAVECIRDAGLFRQVADLIGYKET